MTADEAAFLPQRYAELPSLGRLTGRGNTANVEVVLTAKPDLIVDAGATGETYVSLADRVQQQTGIRLRSSTTAPLPRPARPCARSARALGNPQRGELLADYVERRVAMVKAKVASIPRERRPRVYYARGSERTADRALRARSTPRCSTSSGAVNVAGSQAQAGGLAERLDGAGARLEPGRHRDHRPRVFRARLDRCALVGHRRPSRTPASTCRRSCRSAGSISRLAPTGWSACCWLANILYPDVFDDDLRTQVAEFYRLFYHQEPTPAQLDALLETPELAGR